jgi:hypothetical protein
VRADFLAAPSLHGHRCLQFPADIIAVHWPGLNRCSAEAGATGKIKIEAAWPRLSALNNSSPK